MACKFCQKRLYGSSRLIPLSWHKQTPSEPGNAKTFNEFTCPYDRSGKTIHVYKQLVNSFQHAYGSALAAYELSEVPADLLFRANEYTEAIFSKVSGTQNWYLDTKKDLHNNAVGRDIGLRARTLGSNGLDAEKFMIAETLKAADDGRNRITISTREPCSCRRWKSSVAGAISDFEPTQHDTID